MRFRIVMVFVLALALALWRGGTVRSAGDTTLRRYEAGRNSIGELLDRFERLFTPVQRRQLRDYLGQLSAATRTWAAADQSEADTVIRARTSCEFALSQIVAILQSTGELIHVWPGAATDGLRIQRRWPSGSGVLLLRIARPGAEEDVVPDFASGELDLSKTTEPVVETGKARTWYGVFFVNRAVPGRREVTLRLRSAGRELAPLLVNVEVPAPAGLSVSTVDAESSAPTASVVGLYSEDGQLMVPPQAVFFDEGGFVYRPGQVRSYQQAHYWPGKAGEQKVFFVDGGFSLSVPEGKYRLIVGKGPEYNPVVRELKIESGAAVDQKVPLQRWINMPERKWFSGDGHVHYARAGAEANRRLMTWTQAEDIHLANVVRMGDAIKTYFPQYAFGAAGRYRSGEYALIPGQEDPRTSVMGHTLHMNILSPVRYPEQYYLYDLVFDEVHRQGGLSGYAHAYQPPGRGFWVRQDITMNVPARKVDFLEISEFGEIDDQLYYEFLNLGFKLTATAGSDVPWGNSIGTSRVYAYLPDGFDPDRWFEAVKQGRTFVTTGPMLELTVNGQPPGTEIHIAPGEPVQIKATASGHSVAPRFLEIVSQGDVVRGAIEKDEGQKEISVDFSMSFQRSAWIAARSNGARTSPVYVLTGDEPFWKLAAVPELVETRLQQLRDIDSLLRRGPPAGGEGTYNNPPAFKKQTEELAARVNKARIAYQDLLRRARPKPDLRQTVPQ